MDRARHDDIAPIRHLRHSGRGITSIVFALNLDCQWTLMLSEEKEPLSSRRVAPREVAEASFATSARTPTSLGTPR